MVHCRICIIKVVPFILFIFSIILSIWIYNGNNNKYSTISEIKSSYDFIIVGGGTAGCVLAAKLSESVNKSVLLVEAGDEFNFIASVPLFAALLQSTKYDWAFKTTSQKYSSHGLHNQIQSMPRGKGLGGSNQINYMVHDTDIKNELERWVSLGIKNWNYKKFAPYINSIFHTANSTFNVTVNESELSNLLRHAVREINLNNIKYTNPRNTINSGKRWTSYDSYLRASTNRDNLNIILNSQVTKVIFNNEKHAVAVEIQKSNYKRIINSKSEIILCAGVFNTPQILLLSGIGPSHILNYFRIPVVVNLLGVGRNLHDHLNMPLYVTIEKQISLTLNKVLQFSEFWNYLIHGKGLLSTTPNSGFIKQNDIGILLFGMGSVDENMLKHIANLKTESFKNMFPFHKNKSQEGFVLLTTCLKPISRGHVAIENTNPQNLVTINPKYLSKYKDIECMIRAIKLANDIIKTKTFKRIGAKIHWPTFSNCLSKEFYSDDYLECMIRTGALTGYHPGGSCKMGINDDQFAVVDETLKVKGVTGLRIMDASILPEPLPTYPNSVLVAMAEFAANIIKTDTQNK